jgi:hypothetical protein
MEATSNDSAGAAVFCCAADPLCDWARPDGELARANTEIETAIAVPAINTDLEKFGLRRIITSILRSGNESRA